MTLDTRTLIVLGILLAAGIYATWRMRRVTRGVVYRGWFLFLLSLSYVLTFLFVGGITTGETLAFEISIAVAVGAVTTWYVARSVNFQQRSDGRWVFQSRVIFLAFWLGLFAARVLVQFYVLGTIYLLDSLPIPGPLSSDDVVGLLLVETTYAGATGLLFGTNVGIWLGYRAARREIQPPASRDEPASRSSLRPPSPR